MQVFWVIRTRAMNDLQRPDRASKFPVCLHPLNEGSRHLGEKAYGTKLRRRTQPLLFAKAQIDYIFLLLGCYAVGLDGFGDQQRQIVIVAENLRQLPRIRYPDRKLFGPSAGKQTHLPPMPLHRFA